jgi:hypothetical protein
MRAAVLMTLAAATFTFCICRARAASTADILGAIGEAADRICVPVAQSGHTTQTTAHGDVKAGLSWLAKKLADVGITGTAEIASTEYEGVLQDQLAAALGDIRQCKLKVFDSLQKKLLSGAPDSDLTERIRLAQQRMEMNVRRCRTDVDSIRADIGSSGSSYSYAGALDQVDADTLADLRSGEGQTLVDEFDRLRTHSGKVQGEYSLLAASVKGVRIALDSQLQLQNTMRRGYYPPTVAQAIEGPIHTAQAQIDAAITKEGPLGQDIIVTYTRACDVLAQLTALMAKRITTSAHPQ